MESLKVNLFKNSVDPFLELLLNHNLQYSMVEQKADGPMAGPLDVFVFLQESNAFLSLAIVIHSFLKSRHSRKVMIITKDNNTIHAEGLTANELEKILQHSKSFAVIETEKIQ